MSVLKEILLANVLMVIDSVVKGLVSGVDDRFGGRSVEQWYFTGRLSGFYLLQS